MSDLRQLMAAYFHQDWWDEYAGSWEAAVDDFANREPGRVDGTVKEIGALLDANRSEQDLSETLEALGNFRNPGEGEHAYQNWLAGIRARLSTRTKATATQGP